MTGIEPGSSGVRRDLLCRCVATIALKVSVFGVTSQAWLIQQ